MKRFKIITLEAAKILEMIRKDDVKKKPDGNFAIHLRYDLSENSKERAIILRQENLQPNALFWQLSKILPSKDKNLLWQYLLYVDFSEIFATKNFFVSPSKDKTLSKEEIFQESKLAHGYKLQTMFEDGLELSFDGENYRRFIPFEKSSNMARHCLLSFIDEDLKVKIEPRLCLGMNLSSVQVELSKYFSYRGLYMSTAHRIDSEELVWNSQTVIVLKDYKQTIPVANIFTAKKDESGSKWNFAQNMQETTLNLFDGEGLISPKYSAAINDYLWKKLKYKFRRRAHSWQIRMPFTKGVLHEVDFVKFFREELGFSDRAMKIKDVFGLERDLSKAQVILTESMFKCSKWIKAWIKHGNDAPADPMKIFFDRMREYEHALYLAMTDANLSNNGTVKLNYQFLSTLRFSTADFVSLFEEQIKEIKNISCLLQKIFSELSPEEFTSEDDFEDDFDKSKQTNIYERLFRVLAKNDAFLKDPKVRSAILDSQRDKERDLFLGRLQVNGEQRFLSCDLLGLLFRIAEDMGDKKFSSYIAKWTLPAKKFYMPAAKIQAQEPFVFLRNPHLSMNEQCLLLPSAGNYFYDKYFSHLNGVVMVSCKSLAALALGGADFDGDLVKIISDFRVVNAVKKLHKANCERTLPVIQIPNSNATFQTIPSSIPFELVANTFSNQVGHISNIAVKLMCLADSADTALLRDKFLRSIAECTIVVGLEIDAVKTGKRPTEDIDRLNSELKGKPTSTFLKMKEKFLYLKSVRFTPLVTDKNGFLTLYTSKKNEEEGNCTLSVKKQNLDCYKGALIDLLPQLYLKYLVDKKADIQNPELEADKDSENKIYFEFQRESDWKKILEKDKDSFNKLETLAQLVRAFNTIRRLAKESESLRLWWDNQHRDSFVDTILDLQYDCSETFSEAKSQMYLTLLNFNSSREIDRALNILRESNWHLTLAIERVDKLKKILKSDELEEAVINLLCNFRENGYMLIFYSLCERKTQINTSSDFEEEFAHISQSKNDRWKTLRDSLAEVEGNAFWENFYKTYKLARNDKWSRADFKQSLVKLCRKELSELFNDNFDEALKYFWARRSEDPSRNFFWEVFEENEIIRNLPR